MSQLAYCYIVKPQGHVNLVTVPPDTLLAAPTANLLPDGLAQYRLRYTSTRPGKTPTDGAAWEAFTQSWQQAEEEPVSIASLSFEEQFTVGPQGIWLVYLPKPSVPPTTTVKDEIMQLRECHFPPSTIASLGAEYRKQQGTTSGTFNGQHRAEPFAKTTLPPAFMFDAYLEARKAWDALPTTTVGLEQCLVKLCAEVGEELKCVLKDSLDLANGACQPRESEAKLTHATGGVVGKLLGLECTMQSSALGEDGNTLARVDVEYGEGVAIREDKLGGSGCPINQACAGAKVKTVQSIQVGRVEASKCYPKLILALRSDTLTIGFLIGAGLTEWHSSSEKTLYLRFPGSGQEAKPNDWHILNIAVHFMIARKVENAIQQHYTTPSDTSEAALRAALQQQPPFCPRPLLADQLLSFQYQGQEYVLSALEPIVKDNERVLRGKAKPAGMSGSEDSELDVVVKFSCQGYGPEVHRAMAKADFAPLLYHHADLPLGYTMAVMQAVNQEDTTAIPTPAHGEQLGQLRDALKALGYVHGDLRVGNVMFLKPNKQGQEKIRVVDWDWAGKAGERRFPVSVNTTAFDIAESELPVKPCDFIQPNHDAAQVARLQALVRNAGDDAHMANRNVGDYSGSKRPAEGDGGERSGGSKRGKTEGNSSSS